MSCLITLNLHNLVQAFYLWLRRLSSHFYLQGLQLMLDCGLYTRACILLEHADGRTAGPLDQGNGTDEPLD